MQLLGQGAPPCPGPPVAMLAAAAPKPPPPPPPPPIPPSIPTQEDILVTWATVVMLALRCVGVPVSREGAARLARRRGKQGPPPEDTTAAGLGLQGLVQARPLFL